MDGTLEQILNRLLTLAQERDQLRAMCEQLQAERDALLVKQHGRELELAVTAARRAEATG